MNLASQSVLEGLNACLDHRAAVYVPELNRTVDVSPLLLLSFVSFSLSHLDASSQTIDQQTSARHRSACLRVRIRRRKAAVARACHSRLSIASLKSVAVDDVSVGLFDTYLRAGVCRAAPIDRLASHSRARIPDARCDASPVVVIVGARAARQVQRRGHAAHRDRRLVRAQRSTVGVQSPRRLSLVPAARRQADTIRRRRIVVIVAGIASRCGRLSRCAVLATFALDRRSRPSRRGSALSFLLSIDFSATTAHRCLLRRLTCRSIASSRASVRANLFVSPVLKFPLCRTSTTVARSKV